MSNPLPYQPFSPQSAPPPLLKSPREYSIFGAMIRAPFFNASLSRDVARNWTGIGFWYLFLLLLMTWIIAVVKLHFALTAFMQYEFPRMVKDIPPITIDHGHVSSPVDQPYFIKDSQGKTLAVLDTTGQINTMDDTDALLLLTDHQCWSRQNSQVRQFDLSKVNYFYIDKTRITRWMEQLSKWVPLALLPVALVGSLCLRLIQALIYGAIALGFSNAFSANLTYAAGMRLAIISVTPIILLDTIRWIVGWHLTGWWLIGIGISIAYIAMAVKANSSDSTPIISAGNYPTS